ncbi:unannotated protein [freshwater metagenome]|uniref:Unannotated protein n=1 Tax=freshwater metagenome TaxID=449393 RepID=A0A6J7J1D4_9ZZZZ
MPLLPALIVLLFTFPGVARAAVPADVLVMDESGRVHRVHTPLGTGTELPAPALALALSSTASGGADVRAARAKVRRLRVTDALRTLVKAGSITPADADAARREYLAARRLARRLKGVRRKELLAVLRTADDLATARTLTAPRLKPVMETVRRNAQWWGAKGPVAYGQRLAFEGSALTWQAYPGQGIQIQWLASFARANQLFLAKGRDADLEALIVELVSYATPRAGGIAWESLFRFGGGRPPWVSGLTQGTAIQALARSGARLHTMRWLHVARSALGVFRTAPPTGVRVTTTSPTGEIGAHYLIYSFAPGQRVYNAFLQSLIGLHDYAGIANDPLALGLWLDGERAARREIVQADTGSWSLYQPGILSSLGYHTVLRDFAQGLCLRLNRDRQRAVLELRDITGDPGAVLGDLGRWPDPEPYCLTAQQFTQYLYARRRAAGLPAPSF